MRDQIAAMVKLHANKTIHPERIPPPARRDDEDEVDEEYQAALDAETDELLSNLLEQTG